MASQFDEPFVAMYNRIPRKQVAPGKKQVADFEFIKTLGEGSFATVLKCRERTSNREFAMKILEKKQIQREKVTERVIRERDIIASLDHPFIVQLFCTFQTESHLFLCLTIADNGCLHDYLLKFGSFSLTVSRFYLAEMVTAVEYLHSKNVLHRDVKPENVLLDGRWHVKFTDFGTAGRVNAENPRRRSFVGTPQYVSPELVAEGEKFTCKESDLWALGCCLFQFISGTFPFNANTEWLIFKAVQKCEYKFEDSFPDTEKDFITRLLVPNPEERLGSEQKGGIKELKSHEIFSDIDWENITSATPPKFEPFLVDGETTSVEDELNFNTLEISAPKKLSGNRQSLLSEQAQKYPRLNKHLNGNELIMKESIIYKTRGLSKKKRHLILTDYPSLYYIDPSSWLLKGEIPWQGGLEVRCKSAKSFHLHTPNRIYYLEAPAKDAIEWCTKIEEVKELVAKRTT